MGYVHLGTKITTQMDIALLPLDEEESNLKQAIQLTECTLDREVYSNIYNIHKKNGSQRPVINLKALNSYVHAEYFKMEGIHTSQDLLGQGD